MQNPAVLRPPHWEDEFVLQVDASNRGLGAILSQKDQEGEEHPIAYASRQLQPREQKLSSTEKEYLGIVWAVELFRYYLYGRVFKLQTDHNPLVWLNQVRDKSRKVPLAGFKSALLLYFHRWLKLFFVVTSPKK